MSNKFMPVTMHREREYSTPTIELMEVHVERGFAGSTFQNVQPAGSRGLSDNYNDGGDQSALFT